MSDEAPVRRRLGRPPDANAADTRERLIKGARRAFSELGFDATTNREIAQAAGITPAAIYHYFDSKLDLYAAVHAEARAATQAAFLRAIDGQRGLRAALHASLDALVELNRSDPSVVGFLVSAATDLRRHVELREVLGPELDRSTLFLRTMARDAQAAGELANDLDLRAMEDVLNIMLLGLARFSLEHGDRRRHDAAVEFLKRLLAGDVLSVLADDPS